jgi:hypothetical protein
MGHQSAVSGKIAGFVETKTPCPNIGQGAVRQGDEYKNAATITLFGGPAIRYKRNCDSASPDCSRFALIGEVKLFPYILVSY